MKTKKEHLIKLIEALPDEKIDEAANALQKIMADEALALPECENEEALQQLLKTIVYCLSNSLYDSGAEAEKKNEKVVAKRLYGYRKKVTDAWEIYVNNG